MSEKVRVGGMGDDAPPPAAAAPVRAETSARRNLPLVFLLAGVAVIGLLLWPFLPGLVLAAVLATLARPLHRAVLARVGQPTVAAFISSTGVVLLFLLPLAAVVLVVGREAAVGIDRLAGGAPAELGEAGRGAWGAVLSLAERLGMDPSAVRAVLTDQLQGLADTLATRTLSFLSGIGGWLFQLGAALFALYYLLRDADLFLGGLRRLLPLDPARTDELLLRAREVTHATVYGHVLVAAVQGFLGGAAFALVGLPAAVLWGTIMGVLSLIPILGPPIVWIPAAAYLFLTGAVVRGVILTVVGTLVISTIDNLLRAVLVGERGRIHPLVVFFSVLGGIFAFGAAGIIVGPVVFVLALSVMEMGRLAMEPPGSGSGLLMLGAGATSVAGSVVSDGEATGGGTTGQESAAEAGRRGGKDGG